MVIWGIDWQPIINDLLAAWVPVFLVALTLFVGRRVLALADVLTPQVEAYINAHTTLKQRQILESLAKVAVQMAEQVAKREDIQKAGKAKQEAAYNAVNEALAGHGISGITAQSMMAAIESAVYELKQEQDALAAVTGTGTEGTPPSPASPTPPGTIGIVPPVTGKPSTK